MTRLNLSAPWLLFYKEVKAMFEEDPDVNVMYDDSDPDNLKLKIFVDSDHENKAKAIELLLPGYKKFGNVELAITVIPSNIRAETWRMRNGGRGCLTRYRCNDEPKTLEDPADIFISAFMRNDALVTVYPVYGVLSNPIYYVVFRKKVVQYFTDDLGDMNGIRSTLYQDIAKEIFRPMNGVYYCTDTVKSYQYDGDNV